MLVPWTSVNLVDYYLVRRGSYGIREILVRDGIYGEWGWRGPAAYAVGIVAMVPFAVTAWYTGPVAAALGEADVAIFVGLAASAVCYLLLARSLDLTREQAVIAQASLKHDEHAGAFGRDVPVVTTGDAANRQ